MKQHSNLKAVWPILLAMLFSTTACRNDKVEQQFENDLYEEAANASGHSYFKNASLLSAAAPSPHGSFKLRFNATAQSALDSSGKLPVGKAFPDNSLIVKEVYNGNNLELLVVMKKQSNHELAAGNWLWAEFKAGGEVDYSISKKGSDCTGCHGGNPNRDLTRSFDLH